MDATNFSAVIPLLPANPPSPINNIDEPPGTSSGAGSQEEQIEVNFSPPGRQDLYLLNNCDCHNWRMPAPYDEVNCGSIARLLISIPGITLIILGGVFFNARNSSHVSAFGMLFAGAVLTSYATSQYNCGWINDIGTTLARLWHNARTD